MEVPFHIKSFLCNMVAIAFILEQGRFFPSFYPCFNILSNLKEFLFFISEEDHFPLPHLAGAMFGISDGKASKFAFRKTLTPHFYLDTVPIDCGLCNNFS